MLLAVEARSRESGLDRVDVCVHSQDYLDTRYYYFRRVWLNRDEMGGTVTTQRDKS